MRKFNFNLLYSPGNSNFFHGYKAFGISFGTIISFISKKTNFGAYFKRGALIFSEKIYFFKQQY